MRIIGFTNGCVPLYEKVEQRERQYPDGGQVKYTLDLADDALFSAFQVLAHIGDGACRDRRGHAKMYAQALWIVHVELGKLRGDI